VAAAIAEEDMVSFHYSDSVAGGSRDEIQRRDAENAERSAEKTLGEFARRVVSHDATIGVMAKFRPVRANAKKTARPQGAAGCVILILAIMVGVMVFLYLVMKSNANG